MSNSDGKFVVYLADLYHDYLPTRQHVPLGIAYIGEFLKASVTAPIEIRLFKSTDALLRAVADAPPSLVALSNYTWNQALNRLVGRRIKAIPGRDIPIVMGGPNIRIDPDGVRAFLEVHPFVDRYVLFAGERPFADIVNALLPAGASPTGNDVRALSLTNSFALQDGKLTGGSVVDSDKELDFVPSPYLSGALDPFLEAGFLPIIETNRGCPFSCTFCVWGISALNKLKLFSLDRVEAELNYIAGYGRTFSEIVFADANFGIIRRDVDIAKIVKQLHAKHRSFQAVQVYWSKSAQPHMVDIGKILGKLTHTYVAFQSLDPVVLEAIKRKNISTDKLVRLIEELKGYTHSTQTDLLVGLPNEDFDSHLRSLDNALGYGINLIMGGEIRMLPGSEMDSIASRDEFKLRTKYRMCEGQYGYYGGEFVFETEESVRATVTMSEAEMLQLRVLRTLFFAGVTLGEFRPVVEWMVANGISVVEWFRRMAEPDERFPNFSSALAWCKETAAGEWFDSREEAERHFQNTDNIALLFGDATFTKLNYGMLGRLISRPDEYAEFYAKAREELGSLAPGESGAFLDDLLHLCQQRNAVWASIWGDGGRRERAIDLSPETQAKLREIGYPPLPPIADAQGRWILEIDEVTWKLIQETTRSIKPAPTALNVSQLLERFRGRALFEPSIQLQTMAG